MTTITIEPEPIHGGWIMLCSCGSTEILLDQGKDWNAFQVAQLSGTLYRVTCLSCGTISELYQARNGEGQEDAHQLTDRVPQDRI